MRNRRPFFPDCRKLWNSPQLQSIAGRRHSLSFRRGRSPWSSLFSRPQRFPCCCSSGGRCPCYDGRAVSPVAEKTAVIPQLQFITVVDIYFVAQRQFPLVQTTQLTIEIFTVVRIWWVDVPVCRFISRRGAEAESLVQTVRRTFFFPSEHGGRCPRCAGRACHTCCCQQQVREAQTLQKTIEFPQLLLIKFVDIPFVPQTQILMVQTFQQTTEFPQLQYFPGGRCPC